MKIEHLRTLIAQHFVTLNPTPTLEDAVLANLVLFQCATAPYFAQSPLVLWETAPNVVQVGVLEENHNALRQIWDPLEDYYECDFGDYAPNQIQWPEQSQPRTVQYSDLPPQVQQQAQHHCQHLQRNLDIHKLFEPTQADLALRNSFTIEQCDHNTVNEKLMGILGGGKDLELFHSGIRYHDVPSVLNKAQWNFWLAHNGDEIAGVLGGLKMSPDDYAFRLSYVSVSPSFRQQGVSKQLYAHVLQYCADNHLMLLRSSPGKMTRELTTITHAFDKMVLNSSIPHLSSNALIFETVLSELKQQLPWTKFVSQTKPLCDKWLEQYPPSTTAWSINPMDKKRAFAQFKELLPPHVAAQLPAPFM